METTKYLTPTSDLSVYYSLQHPILLHYPPEYDNSRSAMQDLETIKHLIDALLEKLKKEKPKEYSLIKHLHFDYYHTEKDCFRVMHLASELPKDDARFLFNATINKNLKFANTASFLRGCIKISIKQ